MAGEQTAWGGSNNPRVVPGDLYYANYFINQSGTGQMLQSFSSNGSPRQDTRLLASPVTGETWFSFLAQSEIPSSGAGSSNGRAGITFNDNDINPLDTDSTGIFLVGPQVDIYLANDSGTSTSGSIGGATTGETHLILGKMNVGAGDDTLEVWLDPDLTSVTGPGDLPGAGFISSDVDFASSVDRLGAAVWLFNNTANRAGQLDAILLSDTDSAFFDVTGVAAPEVPEPSAIAIWITIAGAIVACRVVQRRSGTARTT